MTNKSAAIWITAAGVIGYAISQHLLGIGEFIAVLVVAQILDGRFADRKPEVSMPPPLPEVGKHLISTESVKNIRNLLLQHHEMKRTDASYNSSNMAKSTVALVAYLNVYLKKL